MSDLTGDLDDLFAEDDAALDFDAEPQPLDAAEAIDRRLATLRRAERRLGEYDTAAAGLRAELEARITHGRAPLIERVGYLTRTLQLTHQALIAQDPTKTRVVLPNGILASKAPAPEWVWPEPDGEGWSDLMAWIQANMPEAYNQPPAPDPRPDKNAIKAAAKAATLTKEYGRTVPAREDGSVVTDAGEVVPGVTVKAKPREFTPETAGIDG